MLRAALGVRPGTVTESGRLLLRAIVAFVTLPGLVAFAVPVGLLRPARPAAGYSLPGWIIAALGALILCWCVGAFFRTGQGTLAPWAPPRRLVVIGLYRASRNPMYLGVILILTGWAVAFRSADLGLYAVLVLVAFHLRVVFVEEPWLARQYGLAWHVYVARVPRWLSLRSRRAGTAWRVSGHDQR